MKQNLLAVLLMLVCFPAFGQDAQVILQKSYDKCQSIQNGYYEMTKYKKFMSQKDTSENVFKCYFKKLEDDTLFSSAFHYQHFYKGEYSGDALYTGDDLVRTSIKDSTGTIMAKSKWAERIASINHNYTFYSPLTDIESSPLQHDSSFLYKKHSFKFIGEESVNDGLCYHIQVNKIPEIDTTEPMQILRIEYHYWISKEDFIPIQYSKAIDVVMNNDTMYQFDQQVLNKYEINNLKDEFILTLNSIPDYYKITDYVPHKSPDPLPNDTIAPAWELFSLTDEKVSLADLKGQLVLVDFFYKGCYPCMQALPALQALNEKYKDNGLRVIGIDPYDKKEDDIAAFLAKRGVTYTVLLEGKDVAKDYNVSAYPTIYLIDKAGKIIYNSIGYGKGSEEALDGIIRKNL